MEKLYRITGWMVGLLLVGVALADLPKPRSPLLVNRPLTPAWAPLWDWEQPHSLSFQHRVLEALTGVEGVGGCCAEGVSHDGRMLHLCFAPGTPEWYREYVMRLVFGEFMPAYDARTRWTSTSYGTTGGRGTPIRLRWSFVPDGTQLPGVSGGTAPSNLFSSMNSKFGGNTNLWQTQFRNSFSRWQEVAGVRYEEVSDDGAAFPSSPGSVTPSRGDVRIGARNVDGVNGVLAFNYLPNVGDMVLDSSEGWQASSRNYRFLRNTVMHEHGHGLGFGHVIPTDATKLMEPFLNTNFDGPQDDDIRGVHRFYGDPYEVNNLPAQATPIDMTSTNNVTLEFPSLDRQLDVDWYRLQIPAFRRITISVTPIGSTYQVGPEGGTPTTINTQQIQNLQLELRDSANAVIASATNNGVGQPEQITNFVLPPAGGTFYVRVFSGSGSTDDVQRYRLTLLTTTRPTGDADGNGCVNQVDMLIVLFNLGSSNPAADMDGNGTVDSQDLLVILFNLGTGC